MEGTGSGGGAGAVSHRAMWVTLVAMTLSNSMILVDQTAVPLATPDAIRDLGGSLSESQWLLTANILPLAAFMVLGGRLGDLFGLKRVFLTGGFVFVVSTALAVSAQDMPWMISARAAQGCGLEKASSSAAETSWLHLAVRAVDVGRPSWDAWMLASPNAKPGAP